MTGFTKYGHERTYKDTVAWLDEIGGVLEDWGCGTAYAKKYVKKSKYVGIEGSPNQWVPGPPIDLVEYRSTADCILLRDVLDHNPEWEKLLQNAIDSFQRRMVIVFFHYFGPETKVIHINTAPQHKGIPDIQFKREDIMKHVAPYLVKEYTVPADKEVCYNYVVLFLEKPAKHETGDDHHADDPEPEKAPA